MIKSQFLSRFITKNIKNRINPINNLIPNKIYYKTKNNRKIDPYTIYDIKLEKAIKKEIEKKFPYHQIVGEEKIKKITDSKYSWIIDPIDGTKSLILGLPTWSNLIGVSFKKKPLVGFANFPAMNKYYFSDGYKTYLVSKNKKKCITSGKQFREEKFSIVLNSLHVIKNKKYLNFFKKTNKLLKFSGADAYNYCLLAEGKIDSIIDAGIKPYDIIPLVPIINCSGGIISNFKGFEDISRGEIVVSRNKKIHTKVLKLLKKIN